jgi:hypothetical protein
MTGVFRYVPFHAVEARQKAGWQIAGSLSRNHDDYSLLMWWCCGACVEGEAP